MTAWVRPRWRVFVALANVAVAAAVAGSSGGIIAADRLRTKGPIPEAAFKVGAPIDKSLVPDFIPAAGPNGEVVGFVAKDLAIPDGESAALEMDSIPVYASDLKTIVGHMVAGIGFVPLGSTSDSMPAPISTPGLP
jgi:hypothetical protein